MEHPGFYERAGPFRLRDVLEAAGVAAINTVDETLTLDDVRPLDTAEAGHISFLDNAKYLPAFQGSSASACLIGEKYLEEAPDGLMPVVVKDPYRVFAQTVRLFYPDALFSCTAGGVDWPDGTTVHPSAELEEGVRVEPGAVIGPEAQIGRDTVIAAGAVIGYRVHLGRNCYVGPNATITNSLIGDRVYVHAGAGIGQDGYGFAIGAGGHLKIPQVGRVILQDDVEIGANTTIDRGALRDTVIGEGTKIDNQVQIGHNVVIGRHCLIVSQVGISGSTEIGDFVMMGGQAGCVGHITIGTGAQVGADSSVTGDIPAGEKWGGLLPARPMRQWGREFAILKRLISAADTKRGRDDTDSGAAG